MGIKDVFDGIQRNINRYNDNRRSYRNEERRYRDHDDKNDK